MEPPQKGKEKGRRNKKRSMRCQRHPSDLSSGVGVCASCLRERLFALIAAQARQQAQAQAQAQVEDRRKSDAHPPPLVFPRSVSPYICRRSDDSSWHHHSHHQFDQRFYSTPQVGRTSATGRKKKPGKFSLFSSLFSSRSNEADPDPRVSRVSGASLATSSPISSSWFSSLLPGRRKKQSRLFSFEEAAAPGGRRPCRPRDRGMSPTKGTDEDEAYEDYEGSPSASGYSSESSQCRRKMATGPPVRRRGPPQHSQKVSGWAFCLSPLVRASPNRHRNVGFSGEIAFSGEIRASNKPHLSTAASYCANRSRKLADFGRYNSYNP